MSGAIVELSDGPLPTPTPDSGWRLGLIGDPVAHSLSPAMHTAALAELGIPGTYAGWPTGAAELPDRVASLRAPDVLGANVTVPHKQAVMALMDGVTSLAARTGAVNTIVKRDGRLIGDNTDVYGFQTALAAHATRIDGGTGLILGAGGASRAIVVALQAMGASRIIVANRSPDRAATLLREVAIVGGESIPLAGPEFELAMSSADVVVNATALGWHAGETPIPAASLRLLPDHAHVTDLTYRDTDLLLAARGAGLATSDGLEMLLLQGVRALERWAGVAAPVATMRTAAMAARG